MFRTKASQTCWPCQLIYKMLYIYLPSVSTLWTPKNIHSNLNILNTFTKETSSNKVKLPKVGSNAISPRAQISKVLIGGNTNFSNFFFLFFESLAPSPSFFSKIMDDAQTHFGAAHYRLWVLLCTFWACKVIHINIKYLLQALNVHHRTQSR